MWPPKGAALSRGSCHGIIVRRLEIGKDFHEVSKTHPTGAHWGSPSELNWSKCELDEKCLIPMGAEDWNCRLKRHGTTMPETVSSNLR